MSLENVGGRETFYGRLPEKNKWGAKVSGTNLNKKVKYSFDYNDLPGADTGNDMVVEIPAGSQLVSAKLKVGTAWAGSDGSTTAPYMIIGTAQEDGTAIDADGLFVIDALTDLSAGAVIEGAGAQIGVSIGANDGVLTVALDGASTATAGDATLILEYIPFGADAA